MQDDFFSAEGYALYFMFALASKTCVALKGVGEVVDFQIQTPDV